MSPDRSDDNQPPRLSERSAYSIFVAAMKVVLPALAVALIVLVVAWPRLASEGERLRSGISDLLREQADDLSMLNARFESRDSRDRPYSVVADLATQTTSGANLVDLEGPKADMTLDDGAWLALTANQGEYWQDSEKLRLFGDVNLFHDLGFQMQTSEAEIDLKSGSAESHKAVAGHGPDGWIEAEGFRVSEGGDHILFKGKSRLTIYSHKLEGGR